MKKWIVLAIVTSLTGIGFAEAKQIAKKDQQVKQEQKKAPIVKFSIGMIESGRIDPGYEGIPVSQVVDAIEKMTGVEKGEFESTANYNARKVAALTGKFLGDSTLEDTFAFVLPVAAWKLPDPSLHSGLNAGLRYAFNADTSEVRLFALPVPSIKDGKASDLLHIDTKINSLGTYQISNAYGATATVEKTSSTSLWIKTDRMSFLTFKREDIFYINPVPVAQFNMENAKAAKEFPSLKALVVMKLAAPYIVYTNTGSLPPTLKRPFDKSSYSKKLTGTVLGIVFYSGLTGEIFARLPESLGRGTSSTADSVVYFRKPVKAPIGSTEDRILATATDIKRNAPMMVDANTRIDGAVVGPGLRLTVLFTFINIESTQFPPNFSFAEFDSMMMRSACTESGLKEVINDNASLIYDFRRKDGSSIRVVEVDRIKCELK